MEPAAQLLGLCEGTWDRACGHGSRLLHLTLVNLHLWDSHWPLNQDPLVALISAVQHHLNEPRDEPVSLFEGESLGEQLGESLR